MVVKRKYQRENLMRMNKITTKTQEARKAQKPKKPITNKRSSTVVPGCNVNGYNGHPHITDMILWSQISTGFCNVNFPLYNSL